MKEFIEENKKIEEYYDFNFYEYEEILKGESV